MKKYTNYKIGLLTGLLSFNTFSSCVHTSEKLGWCPWWGQYQRAIVRRNRLHPERAKVCYWLTPLAFIGSTIGVSYLIYSFASSAGVANGSHNGSILSNATALPNVFTTPLPYGNLTEWETFVNDSMTKGTTEWSIDGSSFEGSTSTVSSIITPLPYDNLTETETPINDSMTKNTTEWGIDGSSSEGSTSTVSSTAEPDDGVERVADPMVLEERIIQDLKAHGFAKSRIDDWFKKGLSPNAMTKDGYTLLHEVASAPNQNSFRELVKIPNIDLSVKWYVDILHWAVATGYSGIVDSILEGIPTRVDVTKKYGDGNNLYHIAVQGNHPKVIASLVHHTTLAQLEEKNSAGQTPLQLAEKQDDNKEVIAALKEAIKSKSESE